MMVRVTVTKGFTYFISSKLKIVDVNRKRSQTRLLLLTMVRVRVRVKSRFVQLFLTAVKIPLLSFVVR